MNKFVEDVLTNRKMTRILYDSNAKIEIKSTLKLLKTFNINNDLDKLRQEKIESSVVKKRSRKEAYIQMRTEIDDFENRKRRYIKNLLRENFKKYLEMKKELKNSQNDFVSFPKKWVKSTPTLGPKVNFFCATAAPAVNITHINKTSFFFMIKNV